MTFKNDEFALFYDDAIGIRYAFLKKIIADSILLKEFESGAKQQMVNLFDESPSYKKLMEKYGK